MDITVTYFERSILPLVRGFIKRNFIVPFENSDAIMPPAMIIIRSPMNDTELVLDENDVQKVTLSIPPDSYSEPPCALIISVIEPPAMFTETSCSSLYFAVSISSSKLCFSLSDVALSLLTAASVYWSSTEFLQSASSAKEFSSGAISLSSLKSIAQRISLLSANLLFKNS